METLEWKTQTEPHRGGWGVGDGAGETGRLTLLLQILLPCLKEARDKLGADVSEEPLHCVPGLVVLVEQVAEHLGPMGGVWGWHPGSSLETQ